MPAPREFFQAYLDAALWASMDQSTPSGGRPLDDNYTVDDIHPDTRGKMEADCDRFWDECGHLIEAEGACLAGGAAAQAGHDFWLTRNGHGAGFWETPDWREAEGEQLTAACKRFGECDLYVGDDGHIHGYPHR